MQLTASNFFHYYMFHTMSHTLSQADRIKATIASLILGIFTLGTAHAFCGLFLYDKSVTKMPSSPAMHKVLQKSGLVKDPNQLLVPFYQGTGTDIEGRTLKQIWSWNARKKEDEHDFIQWLFPSTTPSRYNPKAPVLTKELIQVMKSDPVIINNLKASFEVMLKFYGLKFENSAVHKTPQFEKRAQEWYTPGNHNFQRITRILSTLRMFGLHDEARAFLAALKEIDRDKPGIAKSAMRFWSQAAQ